MVGRFEHDRHVALSIFRLPSSSLAPTTQRPEDLLARPFPSSEPLRMLNSYARTMMAGEGISEASTAQSISRHFIDLIGLALGPVREEEEQARLSSLRIGRIHTLLGEIEAGYLDPDFSIHEVAARQCVRPRYVQELLAETGVGFAERVLELRLQHALWMLARIDQRHRKVIDIAYSSGFNDVSYFTRRFRARYGMHAERRPGRGRSRPGQSHAGSRGRSRRAGAEEHLPIRCALQRGGEGVGTRRSAKRRGHRWRIIRRAGLIAPEPKRRAHRAGCATPVIIATISLVVVSAVRRMPT